MKKLAVFFSFIVAVLAFLAGWFLRNLSGGKAAAVTGHEKREEVKIEIQNTPASDLIAAAPNANELRANTDGITGKYQERLRDRARKILSGNTGTGTDGSCGSGN